MKGKGIDLKGENLALILIFMQADLSADSNLSQTNLVGANLANC